MAISSSKAGSTSELATLSASNTNKSSVNDVLTKVLKASKEESIAIANPEEDNMVRVRSNFARDRVIFLDNGKLVLHFDSEGFAACPKHLVPVLELEMRFKPGRYEILAAPTEAAVSVVEADLAEALEELKAEEPVAEEPVAEEPVAEEPVAEEPPKSDLESDKPVEEPSPAPRKRGRPKKKTNKN